MESVHKFQTQAALLFNKGSIPLRRRLNDNTVAKSIRCLAKSVPVQTLYSSCSNTVYLATGNRRK